MRLIQNHEGLVQGAPAHKGQGRDFNLPALKSLVHAVMPHQIVERVVQRTQIGIDFLHQIARQKTQALARLHQGARQHNALHLVALQRFYRCRHGQIGFARARRADAKHNVVLAHGL